MVTMSGPAEVVRPFTVADLEEMPDDGRRYELIDGELLVSPAPGWPHQEMVQATYRTLYAACPRDLRVIIAPFAVRADVFNELQPDVLVARYVDLSERALTRAPLLAVEVISPTSRLRDANLKRAAYARLGVPSFWLADPNLEKPCVTAFELDGDDYREVAVVCGDDSWEASRPFAVRVVPADLIVGLLP
jgi:Uma2 family endonuclease